MPFLEVLAKEHPAFVHVPIGLVVALPLAMLGSFRTGASLRWTRTAFFLAAVGWVSSLLALISGWLWGRQIGLIPPGGWIPSLTSDAQVLQRMLLRHEIAALTGAFLGALCLGLLRRASHLHQEPSARRAPRIWERGVGLPAFALGLLWLGAWGYCGRLGGTMVFGNEETNRAAAEAEAKRRNDVEADLPIRALDHASLEPVHPAPFRSKAHGNRWVRAWVPTSGIDAYKAGQALAPGAYAVLSSVEDEKGRPGQTPGPLYFKEVLADGRVAFAFYWGRVPEGKRVEVGGEDAVYWRSPDPKLAACAGCHKDAGPVR